MPFDKIKKLWEAIDGMNTHLKTMLIIILALAVGVPYFKTIFREELGVYQTQLKEDKRLAETYVETITPMVGDYIQDIMNYDQDATNVLLLNYHNTLTSSEGLSYKYLTTLVEKRRGIETLSCNRYWKELEYTQYGEELSRINNAYYLYLDSTSMYRRLFPNLSDLVTNSGAESAIFFPIVGTEGPLGMIVLLYKTKHRHDLEHTARGIAKSAQPLAILLDYYSMKDFFKSTTRDQFPHKFKMKYDS